MKTLIFLTCLLSGCRGFKTTFGVAYEKDGRRLEGTLSFEETGKRVVHTK